MRVLVDPKTALYLKGTVVDYSSALIAGGFNPTSATGTFRRRKSLIHCKILPKVGTTWPRRLGMAWSCAAG